jgi:protein disulfide isomerase
MRYLNAIGLLCALTSCFVSADDASDVHVLTDSNFADFVNSNKFVVAEFYAPWCGHCKNLAPEYEAAATQLKQEGSEVKLAKIDATVEKAISERYGVGGFPTLFWFAHGEKLEYTGGRTRDTIISFIRKATGQTFTTGAQIPNIGTSPLVLLRGKSVTDDFRTAAASLTDIAMFHFVETDSEDVLSIQHRGEEVMVAAADDRKDLKAFIKNNSTPKFGMLDSDTHARYTKSGKGLVWVLPDLSSASELTAQVDKIRPAFLSLVAKFPKYNFAYVDTATHKAAIQGMIGASHFPAIAVNLKAGDKKKFVKSGDLSESACAQFLDDIEAGKVEPLLKSENVPKTNDELVKVVVGKTLKDEVFIADKDVLFEVYAPWCGHCKKLAPEYEKVAQKIRKEGLEDMISITKMDGTRNDSPIDDISWEGFPTLYYIKAGTSKPIPFDGGRDAKSIWKWIANNHSQSDLVKKRLAEAKAARAANRATDEL